MIPPLAARSSAGETTRGESRRGEGVVTGERSGKLRDAAMAALMRREKLWSDWLTLGRRCEPIGSPLLSAMSALD
jgi:hypothetical protein